jgi:hypothetical protein
MSKRPITEDDNPTWEQLRFTASTLALCFGQRTIQISMLDEMATKINSIMDRDHNRTVLTTLDLQGGKNVSLAEIQAELYVRMMDAGDAFQQTIVAYLEYTDTEDKPVLKEFAAKLAEMGYGGPRKAPPRSRMAWRRNAPLFARLVHTVLSDSGCDDDRSAGTADSAIAEIGAAIVRRAYGITVDADSFSEAVRHANRDRSERFPQLQRARVID